MVVSCTLFQPLYQQVPYNKFMFGLKEDNIQLDRKILCQLAAHEPYSFKVLVDRATHMAQAGLMARNQAAEQGTSPRCWWTDNSTLIAYYKPKTIVIHLATLCFDCNHAMYGYHRFVDEVYDIWTHLKHLCAHMLMERIQNYSSPCWAWDAHNYGDRLCDKRTKWLLSQYCVCMKDLILYWIWRSRQYDIVVLVTKACW